MVTLLIAALAVINIDDVLASFETIEATSYDSVTDLQVEFGDLADIYPSNWTLGAIRSVDTASEWDIQLEMTGQWQFSSSSSINKAEFTVNGQCITSECDMHFGFGVGSKYFTMLVDFDGKVHNGDQSTFGIQIYPACGGSLASGVFSNLLVNSSDLDSDVRSAVRHALAGGDYGNWNQMGGARYDNGDTWPVTIGITNNDDDDEVTVTFMSATQSLSCVYSDLFDHDTDLVFGIMGDAASNSGERVEITSVDLAVMSPTKAPTDNPTVSPSKNPSSSPSLSPTTTPTTSPSMVPSESPSEDPTVSPTDLPSKEPTVDPTSDPTEAPSADPTSDPTVDPTSVPTEMPSKAPTTACEGFVASCSNEYASICKAYYNYTAAHSVSVPEDYQHRTAGFDGFEDVDVEPFDIVLSAKDVLIAVFAATTVILMVIICLLIRKGGVGMSRQYKVVSVLGDSEMEELQK